MRTLVLLCLLPAAALAQFDNNVITVTASRQLSVPPDQVNVLVTVTTDEKQTLDSVVAALAGSITATDLTSVSGYGSGNVQWMFNVAVPLASLTKSIAAWQAVSSAGVSSVDFYVEGSSTSAQATASQQCPYPALISDARAQAAKLASAAGVTLGPIVTLEQGITQAPATVARVGDFSQVLSGSLSFPGSLSGFLLGFPAVSSLLTSPIPSCSLTVQFKIGQ